MDYETDTLTNASRNRAASRKFFEQINYQVSFLNLNDFFFLSTKIAQILSHIENEKQKWFAFFHASFARYTCSSHQRVDN